MIERVKSFKLLGLWCNDTLKWNTHIEEKRQANVYSTSGNVAELTYLTELGLTCYFTKIRSVLEYAAPIWSGLPQYLIDEVENIQTRSLKILALPSDPLQSLEQHRDRQRKLLDVST